MIDKLIEKYQNYIDNICSNMQVLNKMTEQNFQIYDKDIVRVWTKLKCYQEIIKDLEELKTQINLIIEDCPLEEKINLDGTGVYQFYFTEHDLEKILGVDIDE